jgi:methyl-accepting chemotaxis protein
MGNLSKLINHSSTNHGPVLASDWKNEPFFVTESFVTIDGKTIGRVVMFSPTEPIKTATKTIRSTFTGVALMVLVIGAIIILLVSGKIVQPLLRMIRITQRNSEGKHDWELQTRGSDEIAQLSKEDDQKRYLNLLYSQSIQLQRLVQDLFELETSVDCTR